MGTSTQRWTRALLVVALLLAASGGARADEPAEKWGWQAFLGAHGYSKKSKLGDGKASSISNSMLVGLRIWQRMTSWAALEAELPVGLTESRDQVATLFVTMPRLQARVSLGGTDRVSPFVVLGAGVPIVLSNKQSSVPSDIMGAGYAGGGASFKLKGLIVGLEGRYMALPATGAPLLAHEWEALLTLQLRNKNRTKAPPPPPPDRDRDGIADARDQCPDQAEDRDGFQDDDGCPELDNDGDGVLDGLDNCQGEAETINGFEDDDGCPDTLSDDVRLLEGVILGLRFEVGSGVMEFDSVVELDKLISILKARPSVRLLIIGHTDDREEGDHEAISEERAQSVKQYMVEAGIGDGRLTTLGRGDAEPFADNSTASGRRANRRVEVKIQLEDD